MPVFEWIWNLFSWLGSAKDTEHRELRIERDALREDLVSVMHAYQQLNSDLQGQINSLRQEIEVIADSLRAERKAHADCLQKLHKHEDEIYNLKVQVCELMRKDRG